MNLEPKAEIKSATRVSGGPATPRKGPPKFKQRQTRQFKSKPPKKGIQGYALDDLFVLYRFRNNVKLWFVIPFSSQLWWWYPWNGGLRHRWVHFRCLNAFHISLYDLRRPEQPPTSFLLQTSLSFAPGRPSITWSCMSWLSTASSEPSRISLQSSEDYRPHPCTSNHLPQAPSPSFKMELYSKETNNL